MSKENWNNRFSINEYFYGKMPNDFLMEFSNEIPKGEVLCIADGEGRNSTFLARQGFDVTSMDFSEAAQAKARQLAEASKVEVKYTCADLNEFDMGKEKWMGIVSVFCHLPETLRRDVHKRCVEALAPHGVMLLEAYSKNQLKYETGGPKDLSFLMDEALLREDFEGLDLVLLREVERPIFEGLAHNGLSSVVQLLGVKR